MGADLDSEVDERFGRARYIIFFDLDSEEVEVIDNETNVEAMQGAGIQTAQELSDHGAEWVLTGHVGPKAFHALSTARIRIETVTSGTVRETILRFKNEEEILMAGNGKVRLAVPSMSPGGVDAMRSDHFSECACFTLVDIDHGKIKDTKIVKNQSCSKGIGFAPVDFLMLLGVDAVIVCDLSKCPLICLREAGIEVYTGYASNVLDAVLELSDMNSAT